MPEKKAILLSWLVELKYRSFSIPNEVLVTEVCIYRWDFDPLYTYTYMASIIDTISYETGLETSRA